MFRIQIVLILLLGINYTNAQNAERFPRLRERIAQAKLREIKENLQFDQATFEKFRPIYLRYEQEITSVDFRKIGKMMRIQADSLSSTEADQLIVDQIRAAKALLEIREKYYEEFKKVITPQQIIKLYQTEAEIRKKVAQEVRRRMMNR